MVSNNSDVVGKIVVSNDRISLDWSEFLNCQPMACYDVFIWKQRGGSWQMMFDMLSLYVSVVALVLDFEKNFLPFSSHIL